MLKTILLIVVAAIAALLIYAATKPDTFRLQRSATIAAPPDKVFALINDLRQFNTWKPQGNGSTVTWAMHGPMPYLNRLMTIFFDMDKTVGKDFEAGLANLKALAEKP